MKILYVHVRVCINTLVSQLLYLNFLKKKLDILELATVLSVSGFCSLHKPPFISLTGEVHIWHNNCLWPVDYYDLFRSPITDITLESKVKVTCNAISSFISWHSVLIFKTMTF